MSTSAEKLLDLQNLIKEIRSNQELISFLDAMGFFALVEFLEKAYQTGVAVTANLEAHIGALFEKFRMMFELRKKIQQNTLTAFLPT